MCPVLCPLRCKQRDVFQHLGYGLAVLTSPLPPQLLEQGSDSLAFNFPPVLLFRSSLELKAFSTAIQLEAVRGVILRLG